jgi:hypothetical protein
MRFVRKFLGIPDPAPLNSEGNALDELEQRTREVKSLLSRAEVYEKERDRLLLKLDRQHRILNETLKAAGGYVWRKDTEGNYVWCDPAFCRDFFAIQDWDCAHQIEGVPAMDLFARYEAATGHTNHFYKTCPMTDAHCLQKARRCRYVEIAYLGQKLKVFDIIKTPLLRDGENGIVGFAVDRTAHHESVFEFLQKGLADGSVHRVLKSDLAKAYYIRPGDECDTFFQTITSFAGGFLEDG